MKLPLRSPKFTLILSCFLGFFALVGCGGAPFATNLDLPPTAEDAGKLGVEDPPADAGSSAADSGDPVAHSDASPDFPVDSAAVIDAGGGAPDAAPTIDAAAPLDACTSVLHSTGTGLTWTDCEPTGSDSADATRACLTYAASVGGTSADCVGEYLPPPGTPGPCAPSTSAVSPTAGPVICYAPSGICGGYCWGYASETVTDTANGLYTCACMNAGSWK